MRQGRATEAHRLILWQAALDLAAEGVRRLDLGAIDTEGAPDLARLKLETGAVPQRLGGSYVALPLR